MSFSDFAAAPTRLSRFLFSIATVVAFAQSVIGNPTQRPTFSVDVDYVSVDAVVTGKDDEPVTNLVKDDFEIIADGRAQRIATFQLVSVPRGSPALNVGLQELHQFDVATNGADAEGIRALVIVIDDLHLIETQVLSVKRALTTLLQALTADDQIAVVFVGRSNLGENFSLGPLRALRTVDKVKEAFGFGLDAGGPRGEALAYARSAVATLRNAVAALSTSPRPRRTVVFVSGGFLLDPNADPTSREHAAASVLRDELKILVAASQRANVPIYTLDPRGMAAPEVSVRGRAHTGAMSREVERRIRIQQDHLRSIATETGGRALVNRSDVVGAAESIVRENSVFYLLGYYPEPPIRDGAFHKIDVHVKRPGLRVRSRRGYVAPTAESRTDKRLGALTAAMRSAIDLPGILLNTIGVPVRSTPEGLVTAITTQVTYPTTIEASRDFQDVLDVAIVALDSHGKVRGSASRTLSFRGAVTTNDFGAATVVVNETITVPTTPVTIRVGVASQLLDKAGTVQFECAPRSVDSAHLSGVLLGVSELRPESALGIDRIRLLLPFQPTTARVFSTADTIRVFAPILGSSRHAATRGRLSVRDQRGSLIHVGEGQVRLEANGQSGGLAAEVPLSGFVPGRYILQVSLSPSEQRSSIRELAFDVR